jgi:L-alanine-DL-glutamate epimerase-like enolase superfamily enzyme
MRPPAYVIQKLGVEAPTSVKKEIRFMHVSAYAFDLKLKHTFRISRGAMDTQPTLIVALEQDGQCGYGEATTNDYYGYTLENMTAAVKKAVPSLNAASGNDPERLFDQLAVEIGDNPFALCAIDQAAHDLWGKLRGQPVYELWGLSKDQLPISNYTIGIDEVEKMVQKMEEFSTWPIFKIKLGTDRDVEIVRALRQHTDATFRVDANGAWSADQTIAYSSELKELGVEFIEQPMHADDVEQMERVFAESALPLIADESCIVADDVAKCVDRFHGVNIKLVKCGGLTPARRMIQQAHDLGLKAMVGCMTESTVGISAIAQLLPLLDFVDMDGAALLASDIATGVQVVDGRCEYPDSESPNWAGNGVSLTAVGQRLI